MEDTKKITIQSSTTLLDALKKMDETKHKLLIVTDEDIFIGLISIGDLQRSILKCIDLNSSVIDIIRPDILVASEDDSMQLIKKEMVKFRMEFMPIIDENKKIKKVIFWEDLFSCEISAIKLDSKVPVVIMAGGLGSRLKPLTNVIPKPLVPIGDKTIIEYIIDRFEAVGCDDFYCSVNYKADIIKYYLNSKKKKLYYFQESQPLGTAGSLYLLKNKLYGTFFVINCDILVDVDLAELMNFHKKSKNIITIVSVIKNFQIPYGTLQTKKNGKLVKLQEKPIETYQINSGLYILEPKVFDYIDDNKFLHITTLIEKLMDNGIQVGVFPVNENSWTDIGNLKEYLKLIGSI